MPHTLLAYSTTDGQTLRICARIQAALEGAGHTVTVTEITDGLHCDLQPFDTVLIGASIRYGTHRPAVLRFIASHQRALEAKPTAFFSVNVVARKPGKDHADSNPYVQTFLRKTVWRPTLVASSRARSTTRATVFSIGKSSGSSCGSPTGRQTP